VVGDRLTLTLTLILTLILTLTLTLILTLTDWGQAKACLSQIKGNVMFNLPRAASDKNYTNPNPNSNHDPNPNADFNPSQLQRWARGREHCRLQPHLQHMQAC